MRNLNAGGTVRNEWELMNMHLQTAGMKALMTAIVVLLTILGAIATWGCESTEPAGTREEDEDARGEDGAEEDTVSVTLYFRYNADGREWLVREQRSVPASGDPHLSAMRELIAGPSPGGQLSAVLPNSVEVLDIGVENGTCTVNVSKEILSDANQVGVSASGEGLALAAIANTLTEFGDVSKVKLLVEGMQSGMIEGRFVEDFWGHMGLPEYLERNEDLIYETPS